MAFDGEKLEEGAKAVEEIAHGVNSVGNWRKRFLPSATSAAHTVEEGTERLAPGLQKIRMDAQRAAAGVKQEEGKLGPLQKIRTDAQKAAALKASRTSLPQRVSNFFHGKTPAAEAPKESSLQKLTNRLRAGTNRASALAAKREARALEKARKAQAFKATLKDAGRATARAVNTPFIRSALKTTAAVGAVSALAYTGSKAMNSRGYEAALHDEEMAASVPTTFHPQAAELINRNMGTPAQFLGNDPNGQNGGFETVNLGLAKNRAVDLPHLQQIFSQQSINVEQGTAEATTYDTASKTVQLADISKMDPYWAQVSIAFREKMAQPGVDISDMTGPGKADMIAQIRQDLRDKGILAASEMQSVPGGVTSSLSASAAPAIDPGTLVASGPGRLPAAPTGMGG